MHPEMSLQTARTTMQLVSWAQAARGEQPGARHWARQVVRGGHQFTLTAQPAEFQTISIRLFCGPDLACDVRAVDCNGQLTIVMAAFPLPEACAAFFGRREDLETPLFNESFEAFPTSGGYSR